MPYLARDGCTQLLLSGFCNTGMLHGVPMIIYNKLYTLFIGQSKLEQVALKEEIKA